MVAFRATTRPLDSESSDLEGTKANVDAMIRREFESADVVTVVGIAGDLEANSSAVEDALYSLAKCDGLLTHIADGEYETL